VEGLSAQVIYLHGEAEKHLKAFAVTVVMTGAALIRLKKMVGHGRWMDWFEKNVSMPGLKDRHARNYMATAKRVLGKLDEGERDRLLTAGEIGPAEVGLIHQAMADVTDARTWEQLWLDLGMMRETKPTGGAQAPAELPPEEQALADHDTAVAMFREHAVVLLDRVTRRAQHTLLASWELEELVHDLTQVRDALADEIANAKHREGGR
jgi:hypothetical protein